MSRARKPPQATIAAEYIRPIIVLRRQLKQVTNLSPSTVARMERRGEFPPRRIVSKGLCGWLLTDIERWASTRPIVDTPRPLKGEPPT